MKCLGFFSFAFEHHGRYDTHDMHRIISVFFAFLRCMVTIFMMIGVMNLDAA